MNLMKLFNFSYLKENLKKSKVTLAFVLLILPILNLVIFLMSGADDSIKIFSLNEMSILTVLGMYILPIVLSIILFSFVFKKKSVDFMGSMPIDRKTIFFTNTLGGIIIIILLLLITAILMMVASAILPNIYVPLGAILDYLTIFIVSYTFVFTTCNIAVSVSGNIPTTLVVTALILFFVPFHHFAYNTVLTNGYHTNYLLSYECSNCEDTYNAYLERVDDKVNYTMPFEMITQVIEFDAEGVKYETSTIGKMALLSIIYTLIGYLLFEKREMEVCETSFKKFKTHQIVKLLTLVPILVVTSKILETASLIALIFAICLLLIYNFVYDLVTRHSIIKIKSNLISFALVFIIVILSCLFIIDNSGSTTIQKDFTIDEVESVQVELATFNYYSNEELITIKDRNLKQKLLDGIFKNYNTTYEEQKQMYHIDIELEIAGNKYEGTSLVEKDVYENVKKHVNNSNTYKKNTLRNIIEANEIIIVGNDYIILDEKGIEILERVVVKEQETSSDFYIPLSIYLYKNHELKEYIVNSNIDSELQKHVVKIYNEKVKEVDLSDVYSFNIINESNQNGHYYVDGTSVVKNEIKKVMNKQVDFNQDIYKISLYRNGSTIYYYANLDEEFFEKINSHSTYEDDEYYGY